MFINNMTGLDVLHGEYNRVLAPDGNGTVIKSPFDVHPDLV